jgi:GT2 family glycosyltransferase
MYRSFEIQQTAGCLRLINWSLFVASGSIVRDQKSKSAAVFVTYNLSSEAIVTIEALNKCDNLDIVVVDNCSSEEHREKLLDKCKNFKNVSLLRLNENFGGAGGYAIGFEYILSKNYYFVLVTEDDARLKRQSDAQEILKYSSNDKVTSIWFTNNSSSSFNFHWTVYPARLLVKAGVPDPRYFMRSDDFEFGMRVRSAKKSLGITDLVLNDIEYFHPIVKENKTVWMEYFSSRNSLESYVRHGLIINLILEPVKKIPYAIFKILKNFDYTSFIIFLYALMDFVLGNMGLTVNRNRMLKFKKYKGKYPEAELNCLSLSEFDEKYSSRNFILLGSSLTKIMPKLSKVNVTGYLRILSLDGCVIAGYYSPLLPVAYLFKKIIVISNISLHGETVSFFVLKGLNFQNAIRSMLALVTSLFFLLIISPVIVLKYLLRTKR